MRRVVAVDPAEAQALAGALLSSLGRWRHVQAVAAAASDATAAVDEDERDLLVAAAWLHDVGYAPEAIATGCHQVDGARLLDQLGTDPRLCALVAQHSAGWVEAEERGLAGELDRYRHAPASVLDALTFADMTVGPTGDPVTLDERIAEILQRYHPDDAVHREPSRSAYQSEMRLKAQRSGVATSRGLVPCDRAWTGSPGPGKTAIAHRHRARCNVLIWLPSVSTGGLERGRRLGVGGSGK